jgi:hypothetical protein
MNAVTLVFESDETEAMFLKCEIVENSMMLKIYFALKFGLALVGLLLQIFTYRAQEFRSSLYGVVAYGIF